MKLAKVLPAMAALVVLSACASDAPKWKTKRNKCNPTVTDKTVVYTLVTRNCNCSLSIENQEPTAAMVMVV